MRRFRFAQTLAAEVGATQLRVWVAASFHERLLGLAWLPGIPPCRGLLIPACAAVHTWGMRFAVDIAFLEWPPAPHGPLLSLRESVPPRRVERIARPVRHTAVLEVSAGILEAGYPAVTFKSCLRAT